MPNNNSQIKQDRRLRSLIVDNVEVNTETQRPLNKAWAEQIALTFDPNKMQTPHVSERDGRLWCMDGQHTLEALRLIGWGDQSVQCWVYTGLDEAAEAELYLDLNRRKANSAFDAFRVAVKAGRPAECDIDRIVRACGLHIDRTKTAPGSVCAVSALRKVYDVAGAKTLARALRIVRDAYGDPGLDGPVIQGIALVCQRYDLDLNDTEVVRKLASAHGGVGGLTNKANVLRKTMGGGVPQNMAAAAVEILNSSRGGKKLPGWWKA